MRMGCAPGTHRAGVQAERLIDDVNRQLHNLMGARKFALLREGMQQERLGLVAVMQPPGGLKRKLSRQKAAGRKHVDSLIRKLGINRTKVNRISRRRVPGGSCFLPDLRKVAPGLNLREPEQVDEAVAAAQVPAAVGPV